MAETHDRPDHRCAAHQQMEEGWETVRDVERGTLHLRKLGEKRLPKFAAESPSDYEKRCGKATLFNAYNRTVNGLVGMVFKKNPVLGDDVPVRIRGREEVRDERTGAVTQQRVEGHWENLDLAGTHGNVFCRQVLRDAFEGHAFILVDMPPSLGPNATAEDDLRQNRRPFWVKYKASQAVNFRPVSINGRVEIGQITFEEDVSEAAGRYGERQAKQYRTFWLEEYVDGASGAKKTRVRWELKRLLLSEKGEETFVDAGGGVVMGGGKPGERVPFERIPVAVVYGRQTGFLQSQPVLLDLALINIKHYQKRSEYDTSLSKGGFFIPVFIGRDTSKPVLTVGPANGIDVPVGGDAKYMEPQGHTIKFSREDLQDLKEEMAALGLSVITSRPSAKATATEAVIDFAQESSELETIALSEADAVELCLQFHAQYLGERQGGSITLGSHLRSLNLTPAQVTAYSNMVGEGQLRLTTLWSILMRGDALPEDFDAKRELTGLYGSDEEPTAAERAAGEDASRNRPGGKPAGEAGGGEDADEE
jgi:hypothetical protein